MVDEAGAEGTDTSGTAAGGTTGATGATGATATTQQQTTTQQSIDIDKLGGRFAEEREKARARVLKELGFDKLDDAKAALKAAKDKADAELSEAERLKKTIDEYKPKVDRVESLEQRLIGVAKRELESLPEAARAEIMKRAGEDPERILDMIEMLRAAGIGAAATQQTTTTTTAPTNTASAKNTPKPGATRTKFDEWNALEGRARDMFYGLNRAEIEKTRPAGQ